MPGIIDASQPKERHYQMNAKLIKENCRQKMFEAMQPKNYPSEIEDWMRQKLEKFLSEIESDIFEAATSKSEFYRLLNEKYYKIQKALDERKQKREGARGPQQQQNCI